MSLNNIIENVALWSAIQTVIEPVNPGNKPEASLCSSVRGQPVVSVPQREPNNKVLRMP
jgi:hypothetical protein